MYQRGCLSRTPTPETTQTTPPCPQVVEQVVANLGLFLIQLGEKVQKQRKAAVVLLHLAQVPRWGEESYHLAHTLRVGSPPDTEIAV